jgi:hypothetical protein
MNGKGFSGVEPISPTPLAFFFFPFSSLFHFLAEILNSFWVEDFRHFDE